MLTVTSLDAFEDNYIWLIRRGDDPATVLVDPGDADPVMEAVARDGIRPVAILLTHHHGDHTGGVGELVERFRVPVYGPVHERIPACDHPLGDGNRVTLAEIDATFEVLELPGHTRGHLAYYGHDRLFCGDTLFTGGCGRLFEGSAEQMHASLARIAALPPQTAIHCAHEYTLANLAFAQVAEPGNRETAERLEAARAARAAGRPTVPSTLELELRTNPFLRSADPDLIAAAERFAGHRLTTGAEVFATVRHWKDTLD
ncbi:hydroxyacylglutathione hydrolase [Endothiovibrio diazotrophicus]